MAITYVSAKNRGLCHQVRLVDITAALLVLVAARSASADRCVVHGDDVTLENLTVNGFTVGVASVKADATMTSDRAGITIDVAGPIAFRGTVSRLWYTVRAESVVGGGLVTMSPGAHLIGERLDGGAVAGAAVIYSMDVMQGEDKAADETVTAVSVPCESLTLDWSADPIDPPYVDGKGWRSRAAALTFHAAPKASSPSVTFAATACEENCLEVRGTAAKNGYRLVGTTNQSVAINGWVKASDLQRIPDTEGFGYMYGCTGDHGAGGFMGDLSGTVKPTSLATLASGTQIYDAPTGTIWATVTKGAEFEVRFAKGDAWAEILHLPGITDPEGHAYVPVTSLKNRRAKPD